MVLTPAGRRIEQSGTPTPVQLDQQGFYEVHGRSNQSGTVSIAANLDTTESDLSMLDTQELNARSRGRPGTVNPASADAATLTPEDQERRQNFWWYLLMAGIVLLGVETAISNRMKGPIEGTRITPTAAQLHLPSIRLAPCSLMNDAHVHFFSEQFFETLGRQRGPAAQSAADVVAALWDPPGSPDDLADRWVQELDRHGVARASLIASVPGDEESVARAVARHPVALRRLFHARPDRPRCGGPRTNARSAVRASRDLPVPRHAALSAARSAGAGDRPTRGGTPGTAMFVHCGALSVGVRKKLGLPSRFDVRLGNPLDLHALAADFPGVPFIIPHFGAGLFREALLVADLCTNVYLDTSSSNRWMAYHPALTLADVFRQALAVTGPDRLLFGTDSSFFPRGWNREVYQAQPARSKRRAWTTPSGSAFSAPISTAFFPLLTARLVLRSV